VEQQLVTAPTTRQELRAFPAYTETISVWESLFAILRHRNTLTYLFTYLHTLPIINPRLTLTLTLIDGEKNVAAKWQHLRVKSGDVAMVSCDVKTQFIRSAGEEQVAHVTDTRRVKVQ